MSLRLALDESTWLILRAAPEEYGELVQMSLRRLGAWDNLAECEIDWMVNGQRLESPEVRVYAPPPRSTLRSDLPRLIVQELGMAQQFALKACDYRWTLSAPQLLEVRRFVELYEEEVAWEGDEREGGTGGFVAPADGWPKWEPRQGEYPAPRRKAMSGEQLFELLSPSVFQLEVQSKGGTAQGSAVAVSESELITNCHVLEGARRIIVRQASEEFIGRIVSADPKFDRCVLEAKGGKLTPIKGLRALADLKVGEALYTLGAPSGLELTLGDGILSGLRKVEEFAMVQTTAPISPGSSGGGLFDASGNLVGITTLVLAGRKRLNQSLNFAVPAEAFWQQ